MAGEKSTTKKDGQAFSWQILNAQIMLMPLGW